MNVTIVERQKSFTKNIEVELMTREEKQKAIYVLKNSAPVFPLKKSEEYNDYVQTIVQIIDWLEQEPVLDKIRAEILEISSYRGYELGGVKDGYRIAMVNVLNIIDKYKAENEG